MTTIATAEGAPLTACVNGSDFTSDPSGRHRLVKAYLCCGGGPGQSISTSLWTVDDGDLRLVRDVPAYGDPYRLVSR